MKNLFPNLNSVITYSKPLYIIQLLTIYSETGGRFFVIYAQDMQTFKIVYHHLFEVPVKITDVVLILVKFFEAIIPIDYRDITLVFLKTSPFSNQKLINLLNHFNIKVSYYNRSERLELYYVHKLYIKTLIRFNPYDIEGVVNLWNSLETSKYMSAKLNMDMQKDLKSTNKTNSSNNSSNTKE